MFEERFLLLWWIYRRAVINGFRDLWLFFQRGPTNARQHVDSVRMICGGCGKVGGGGTIDGLTKHTNAHTVNVTCQCFRFDWSWGSQSIYHELTRREHSSRGKWAEKLLCRTVTRNKCVAFKLEALTLKLSGGAFLQFDGFHQDNV